MVILANEVELPILVFPMEFSLIDQKTLNVSNVVSWSFSYYCNGLNLKTDFEPTTNKRKMRRERDRDK